MEINLTQFCSIPYIDSLSNWAAKNQPFRYVSIRKSPNSEPQWHIASIQLARTPIGLINPKESKLLQVPLSIKRMPLYLALVKQLNVIVLQIIIL